jgi:hypothetical protein
MNETNYEYKLRSLFSKFIDYMENSTSNYDDLCDCGLKSGSHMEDCRTTYFRKDVANFEKELSIMIINHQQKNKKVK